MTRFYYIIKNIINKYTIKYSFLIFYLYKNNKIYIVLKHVIKI